MVMSRKGSAYGHESSSSPPSRRQRVTVACGGVSLEKQCVPERVLSIRRIRVYIESLVKG